MAEDLHHYITYHNIKKFSLIGHSMGGKTAMMFSSLFPEFIDKMIVVDILPIYYKNNYSTILNSLKSLDLEKLKTRSEIDKALENDFKEPSFRSFLLKNLHRIDKDTSGLLVVAKTDQAMANLSAQFKEKTSDRSYIALVWGNVENDMGTIEGNIGRHPKNRLQNTVHVGDNKFKGKHAITHYEVIERFNYLTLVNCTLETGRTHQIRVHMKHIGHTLFNDERYGGDKILKGTTFTKYRQFVENCFKVLQRQALHAKTLAFDHPITNERLKFSSNLPDDFKLCIDKWRAYSKYTK